MGFVILFGIIQIFANSADWFIDKRGKRIAILVHAEYLANATAHLLELTVPFYKEHKTGEVWDKIRRASEAIFSLLNNVVISIAPQILSVVIGLGIAAYISPLLASVLVAGIILYIFTLFIIVPPIVKLQKKGQEAWGKSYGYSFGVISNFQAIKQSGAESHERKKIWGKFVGGAFSIWYKVQKIWSSINFYQRTIVLFTQISIFVISVGLIQKDSITIGELIALNGYAAMVFGPFITLGHHWQIIQNGIVAIERAEKILLLPTEQYEDGKENIDSKDFNGSVEFRNVFFAYKNNEPTVLKDLDFKVNAGETVALVGESGVGKSTAMELVSGYYFPSKGKVLIDGYNTKEASLKSIRQNIAIVPQEPVLFNDTVKHNIKYGSFKATEEQVKEAAREAHADVFIEQFPKKYNQVVGERGIRLSVGQKQRIAIARAMLRNPKYLFWTSRQVHLMQKRRSLLQNHWSDLWKTKLHLS